MRDLACVPRREQRSGLDNGRVLLSGSGGPLAARSLAALSFVALGNRWTGTRLKNRSSAGAVALAAAGPAPVEGLPPVELQNFTSERFASCCVNTITVCLLS